MTRIIESLAEISGQYDALFCDLWGCLHDGLRPIDSAVAALQAFRRRGGRVVLLTNAPRPRASVQRQIEGIGVPADCWDSIATSGDSARAAMFEGAVGRRVHHIGGTDDESFFEPIHIVTDAVAIERVPLGEAEGIVCTGPRDAHADPAGMRADFLLAKQKGLKLLCANPDIVVDRGDTREWCAGALAALYSEMGGESLYFGKPHPPIYDLARRRLVEAGGSMDDQVLAVGDGIGTDVAGALGEDIDVIFVTGGLARAETGTTRQPDPKKLAAYIVERELEPTYAMGKLR